ncbi:hypothetical protein [Actinocorallia herbida]|uniref:hypothetical protein n=1 Tax=Actinocorallia herbida TaxID=58109 RepID=UPI001476F85D|nr:hypothetical protein [Actinocorallia herbida]
MLIDVRTAGFSDWPASSTSRCPRRATRSIGPTTPGGHRSRARNAKVLVEVAEER